MKKIIRKGLDWTQKLGLDELMIQVSKIQFLRKTAYQYGWQHESFSRCRVRAAYLQRQIAESQVGFRFEGKDVLEIGAGTSIGIGYFLYNEGYRSWTASDHGRQPNFQLEQRLAKEAEKECGHEVVEQIGLLGKDVSSPGKLNFLDVDITEYDSKLSDKFDFIFSIAVLEHIPREKMGVTLRNMASYIRNGGVMLHAIDLKDHVNPLNPFGFYKYEEEAWVNLTHGSIFHTNRLRPKDYHLLFEECGIKVIHVKREKEGVLPKRMCESFRERYSEEDLRTGEVIFAAVKAGQIQ